MLYQPFLPEVASGLIDPRAVVVPLRRVLRRTELVVGEVRRSICARETRVRPAGRRRPSRARLRRRDPRRGVVVAHAPDPRVGRAWRGFQGSGRGDLAAEPRPVTARPGGGARRREAKRAALTFVFVGAGFAGIEALGELEDLARVATRTIPALDRSDQRWVMVEAAPRILPELEPNLASYAAERLRGRDIDIRTATRLERIEDGIVHLSDGEAFAAETLVWTAGVRAAPLAAGSGVPGRRARARQGRPRPPGLWDGGGLGGRRRRGCARRARESGNVAAHRATRPASGPGARRQRRGLAAGRPAPPVPLREQGHALLARPLPGRRQPARRARSRGFPAWFLHRTYHLLYMPTFSRKARIALDWTIALLFPRDIAQLGSLEHPRDAFRRAAGDDGEVR